MKLLLDSHVVLWALTGSERLSPKLTELLLDPANDLFVSAASAWELAIKQSTGRLRLPGPAEMWLISACEGAGYNWLDVTPEDAVRVRTLPHLHGDPFDRLLIATASRGFTLVTEDRKIRAYGIPVLPG